MRADARDAGDDDASATSSKGAGGELELDGAGGALEDLRTKLHEAERAARESELVARSKVSKAFERLKDADAAANEERERAAKLERELERVKASCEETM